VLATNRPADLDAAVIDRVDEMIEFPLPELAERAAPAIGGGRVIPVTQGHLVTFCVGITDET
jgi:hypothetical protein